MIEDKNVINVACCFDNDYVQHATVMLYSLLVNNQHYSTNIFLIGGRIDEGKIRKLEQSIRHFKCKIEFVEINEILFQNFHAKGHVSAATYYRIILAEILPANLEKVLYLDCDIIVNGSITELWNIKLDQYLLAASIDYYSSEAKMHLKLPKEIECFNAGVMLINLKLWRDCELYNNIIPIINSFDSKLINWDQDALNIFCISNWFKISLKWNYRDYISKPFPEETILKPIIIHFLSPSKPWHFINRHNYKYLYYKYLRKTTWKNFIPEDKTFGNYLRKYNLMPLVLEKYLTSRKVKLQFY